MVKLPSTDVLGAIVPVFTFAILVVSKTSSDEKSFSPPAKSTFPSFTVHFAILVDVLRLRNLND